MCGQLRSGEAGLDNSVCAQAAAPALCHMWQCAPQCGDQASLQLPPQPHQASPAGKAKPLSTAVRTTARPVHSASLRAVLLCTVCTLGPPHPLHARPTLLRASLSPQISKVTNYQVATDPIQTNILRLF